MTSAARRKFAEAALRYMDEARDDLDFDEAMIASMSFDEILSLLESQDIPLDVEMLEAQARKKIGPEALLMLDRALDADGLTDAQREDIEARVEGAVARGADIVARRTMATLREKAMVAADERDWDRQYYVWISVGEGSCPDCHGLHGTTFLMDMWEGMKPGDGTTFCGDHCRCRLFPVDVPIGEEGNRIESMREDLPPRPG